jgi:nucleotide-binding universal stress UspA family protein
MIYGDTGYDCGDFIEQDAKEIEREIIQTESEFRDALGNRSRMLEWRSAVSLQPLSDRLAGEACRADLVLIAAPKDGPHNATRQIRADDLIMQVGRPVLQIASAPVHMERMLVAWKDTREARRAVADALPLLKQAKQVSLVEVTREYDLAAALSRLEDVAQWLGRHGIAAKSYARATAGDDAAELETSAEELETDIVVAGAYGHSRIREWALGSVTRTLLRNATRSALVSH